MTKNEEVKVEYYENGNKKREEHYKDGKLDGVSTLWFEDGQLKVYGDFKNDVLHGDWVGYYENGEKICSKTFEHGEEVFTTPTNCGTSYLRDGYIENSVFGKREYRDIGKKEKQNN